MFLFRSSGLSYCSSRVQCGFVTRAEGFPYQCHLDHILGSGCGPLHGFQLDAPAGFSMTPVSLRAQNPTQVFLPKPALAGRQFDVGNQSP
jgi:hypothetical protein